MRQRPSPMSHALRAGASNNPKGSVGPGPAGSYLGSSEQAVVSETVEPGDDEVLDVNFQHPIPNSQGPETLANVPVCTFGVGRWGLTRPFEQEAGQSRWPWLRFDLEQNSNVFDTFHPE